jgi:hypothetical protein
MKSTVLELTQEILSSMDSDEINAITDTTEALQVVAIIKRCYFDIVSRLELPEHFSFFELTASGDNAKPTLMTLPSDVINLLWIKYDKIADGETANKILPVKYKAPEAFFEMMYTLDTDQSNVVDYSLVVGSDSFPIFSLNDKAPDWWTSMDDNTLIFDSYDADVDTTLQKSKTVCYGQKTATWTQSGSFTPDLDAEQFSLLLNKAKALAWAELKQADHALARKEMRDQQIHSQRAKLALPHNEAIGYLDTLPNYGRRTR